jgi:UDP:flavonoid glycosyltransferase YjiC (YdhE family)
MLYADIPELFPAHELPPNHSYLGPVIWSPTMDLPVWWDSLPKDRPIVYVTLGSSGQGDLLPRVLQTLAPLPLTVIAATAGRSDTGPLPSNAHVQAFLRGEAAARRASLVICNGGSPTSQQALAAGVPVLGIAGNLDQFLNMHGIVAAGAGQLLRGDRLSKDGLRRAVTELLEQPAAHMAAERIAQLFRRYPAPARLAALLEQMLEGKGA